MARDRRRLLLVGSASPEHIGAHLVDAATELGVDASLADMNDAWPGGVWWRRLHYHVLRKRPTALAAFSQAVLELCRAQKPDLLLTTGIAPVSAGALAAIGRLGIRRASYLTDDPWNPANGAAVFWEALRTYDTIYSPRMANMHNLRAHGCPDVRYLPFAYNPRVHFRETAAIDAERTRFACDLVLIGGADADRVTLVRPLLQGGLTVGLYGGYWDRYAECRTHFRGIVIGREFRLAVSGGLVHLCMGRKANRDGHAMRTFELPATGAAMLVEDTTEHRDIFGGDGERVIYYRSSQDIIESATELVRNPDRARALAHACREHICNGRHTYAARLHEILDHAS